ncbi:MAG TPA: CoA transferase [Acidimicrobiia bacterium]|jgi:benzylsuccinate CoA-transferase BbsE subunit
MLAGVRVLDLSGEALAYAGRTFADLGADVILVEQPGGSPARRVPPIAHIAGADVSAHFAFVAAGKRSIVVDREHPRGRDVFDQLVDASDVALVHEDTGRHRAEGIDAATLRTRNERLVVACVSAFGSSGPRHHWRGSDLVAWAASGAALQMGDADRPPVAPGGNLADTAGALNAAMGTMLALRVRQRTGRGQDVDVSQQEAVMSVAMEAGPIHSLEGAVQRRTGARRTGAWGLFPVQDGMVEIVPALAQQWDALAAWMAEVLGVVEITSETFRGSTLDRMPYDELIRTWTMDLCSRYTKQEFFLEAQRRHIPCGPVNNAADLLEDPQLAAVGAWVDVAHPDTGTVRLPRGPVRFDGEAITVGPVPGPGEHTDDVLRSVLEMGEDAVAALHACGAVHSS